MKRFLTVGIFLSLLLGVALSHTDVAQFSTGSGTWVARTAVAPSTSATNYFAPSGFSTPSATSTDVIMRVFNVQPTRFICHASTAPTSGKSWTVTVVKNETNAGWQCVIADAATACSADTSGAAITESGGLAIQVVPAGTPASGTISCLFAFVGS